MLKIWNPYVATYIRLQIVEQQQQALLRASFDFLVTISSTEPFTVVCSDPFLDHMVGRPMMGESIRTLPNGTKEQQDLDELLSPIIGRAMAGESFRTLPHCTKEIRESDELLSPIIGRPRMDDSIQTISNGYKEQRDFERASMSTQPYLRHSWLSALAVQRLQVPSLPVAHMIRSCWRVGGGAGDLLDSPRKPQALSV